MHTSLSLSHSLSLTLSLALTHSLSLANLCTHSDIDTHTSSMGELEVVEHVLTDYSPFEEAGLLEQGWTSALASVNTLEQ